MDTTRTIESWRRHEEITSSRTYNRIKDSFPRAEQEAVIALALLRKLSPRLSSDRTIPYDRLTCFVQDDVNPRENADEIMKHIYAWTLSLSDEDVLIPGWIAHILPDDPLPASIIKSDGLSENARYAELDDTVIPVIRHVIAARSPMAIQITPLFGDEDLGIIQRILNKAGIPAFILNDRGTASGYDDAISAALYAYHHGGVLLTEREFSAAMDNTLCRQLSLRISGMVRKPTEGISLMDTAYADDAAVLQKQGILVLQIGLSYIKGQKLMNLLTETFGRDAAAVISHTAASYGVSPEMLYRHRAVISEITKSGDTKSLAAVFASFSGTKHAEKPLPADGARYDIRVVNTDTPITAIERMAARAIADEKPMKLLLTGPSGTGKSAYANHIAASAGLPLMSIKPSDIFFSAFGESEKAIDRIFSEASATRSILLFDEIDSYISRKSDPATPGTKSFNELANCFLQALEAFNGIMIGTTNYLSHIDPAFIRRFNRVVDFSYPTADGLRLLFDLYFPSIAVDEKDIQILADRSAVGPGDFASLGSLTELMEPEEITKDFIMQSLLNAARARGGISRNPIGFR